MSIWDSFINKYSLSKTLRFELKPTPETKSLVDIIKKDKELARLYKEEMKPMLDDLHEKFIAESLNQVKFDTYHLKTFDENLQKLRELNKNRRESQSIIKELEDSNKALGLLLKKTIEKSYNNTSVIWVNKYFKSSAKKVNFSSYEILTKECVLSILEQENQGKAREIKEFKGFFTYFVGFNQNRENYYTNKGKATEVSYRLVDENLIRFLNNRFNFQILLDEISELNEFKSHFDLENYNNVLTQEKIDYFNEKVVGKINLEVNQYCHNNKAKLPKLKILYKQIGSSKSKKEIFEIDKGEEWQKLQELIEKQQPLVMAIDKLFNNFFSDTTKYDLEKIFLNKQSINTMSNLWFGGGWQTLAQKLVETKVMKFDNKNDDYKIPEAISLREIEDALNIIESQEPGSLFKEKYLKVFKNSSLWQTFLAVWGYELAKNYEDLKVSLAEFKKEKNNDFWKNKEGNTELVKKICDGYLSIERMVKYHKCKEELDTDSLFYNTIDNYLVDTDLDTYYNAFRNHLTKKPFSKDKIKLNFENSTLGDGFDVNKETANLCVFLRSEDSRYYLAVIDKKYNFSFDKTKNKNLYAVKFSDKTWTKFDYKLLPGPNKMLPKVCFAKNNLLKNNKKGYFELPTEILEIRKKESFKKGDKFEKNDLTKWINYFVDCMKKYPSWQTFDFTFSKAEQYSDVSKFYNEVETQGYKLEQVKISLDHLNALVRDRKIYLFEIYNKDLSKKSTGIKNVHTLLFNELLKPENTRKIKLLGGAEIFFREASKDKDFRKDSKGRRVLKAKRYYSDKFFLHFPIEIRGPKTFGNLNQEINKTLYKSKTTILGIDRGEKHLLYYSLISPDGKIIKQGSFNRILTKKSVDERRLVCEYKDNKLEGAELVPTGKKVGYIDYQLLLDYYEKKRILARQSWQAIGKIKDLKEGYLSQVVHEIYKLVVDHNAVVVLEDLNSEFKAKRTARVEKSVYKKFELSLAKKLGHLVFKDRQPDEKGGVLNGYQLTPQIDKVSIFEKAKQWGILFYIRPDYTSTTDPLTGWRKHLYVHNSTTKKEFEKYFAANGEVKIDYDFDKRCYKFSYKDKNKNPWILYAYKGLNRYYYDSKNKQIKSYDLHANFESLLSDFDKKRNINEQIEKKEKFQWNTLVFYWNLLNQIRNTDRKKQGNENDFLQSPVWSKTHSCFYDSRKAGEEMPQNGDANGAYNIARKGILVLDRIRNHAEKDPDFKKSPDLFISNDEWDNFARKE